MPDIAASKRRHGRHVENAAVPLVDRGVTGAFVYCSVRQLHPIDGLYR